MSLQKEIQNQIKIREAMNKKWGGKVYTQQEITNLKQKLKKVCTEESKNGCSNI
jgi:hypothetical protein